LIFPGQDIPQRKPKIESMKIVEITDSSPTTVFIQRHIASLQEKNVDLNDVALYGQIGSSHTNARMAAWSAVPHI